MLNRININGELYNIIGKWRNNINDKNVDIDNKIFPYPKVEKKWSGQEQFLDKLIDIQQYIESNKRKNVSYYNDEKCRDCLICGEKCVTTVLYKLNKYLWDDGLEHYIKKHNIEPNRDFIDMLFNYQYNISNLPIKIVGRVRQGKSKQYVKLHKNQIMIMDALMKHGGYNKKYYDMGKSNIIRYSEHFGFFDIRDKFVQNIIVSGNTLRVDRHDEEIFLPINTSEAFEYEYLFHTHPPTPKPGGRANDGILYEFPSIGDIFHFIDHFNNGKTIGSLVMTSEGLYNIRKKTEGNEIKINEDKLYNEMRQCLSSQQEMAIDKYGINFTTYQFYKTISQDKIFIENINKKLRKFDIYIDFFPRTKDFRGSWIVDTIYIPLYKK